MDKRKLILTNFMGSNDSLLDLNFIKNQRLIKDYGSDFFNYQSIDDISICKSDRDNATSPSDSAYGSFSYNCVEEICENVKSELTSENDENRFQSQTAENDICKENVKISKSNSSVCEGKTPIHRDFTESIYDTSVEQKNNLENSLTDENRLKSAVSFYETYKTLSEINKTIEDSSNESYDNDNTQIHSSFDELKKTTSIKNIISDFNLNNSGIPVQDRIMCLWTQIMNLKYVLSNLHLNLKEQQMECLLKINEFLIKQTINSKNNSGTFSERYSDYDSGSSIKLTRSLIDLDRIKSDVNELLNWKTFYQSNDTDSIIDQFENVTDRMKKMDCICFKSESDIEEADKVDRSEVSKLKVSFDNSKSTYHPMDSEQSDYLDNVYKVRRKFRSTEEIANGFPNTKCCQSDMIIKLK